jgi:hypothetical protein
MRNPASGIACPGRGAARGLAAPGTQERRDPLPRRVKNQPLRVVGPASLFPPCYLQEKLQLERVSRELGMRWAASS